MPRHFCFQASCLAVVVLLAGSAEATGRYRLPSNVPQFLGYGNGPGYHAPMVLGVLGRQAPPRVRRVLHPPMSPTYHTHGFGHGATLIGGAGHEGWAPTEYHGPTPAYAPTPAAPVVQAPMPRKPGTPPPGAEPRSPSDTPAAEAIPLPRK